MKLTNNDKKKTKAKDRKLQQKKNSNKSKWSKITRDHRKPKQS